MHFIICKIVLFYSPPYWEAVVKQEQCKEFFGEEKPCTLYFNFCENINFSSCAGSTVCLISGSTSYSFGQYNMIFNPFAETGNLFLSKVMLYYCFTAEVGSDSLVAFYDHGKTYPKCTNNVTSTLFTLQCAKGQDWDEGLHGNASTFLRFIRPSPEGPCLVCVCVLSVTRTHARTHAHTHTHTHIHTHTHAHTHLKIYPSSPSSC